MRREEKVQVVEELKRRLREYPTVAVVDFTGVPADLVQKLRQEARGELEIKVAKRTLIERALKESGKGLDSLTSHLRGQPALIFSKLNPFKLYRLLEAKKRRVPAKPPTSCSGRGRWIFPPVRLFRPCRSSGQRPGYRRGRWRCWKILNCFQRVRWWTRRCPICWSSSISFQWSRP
jgi:hypothetical protein